MLPSASQATTTMRMPIICADAGLVPCADDGIRQTSRCPWPREASQLRIASRPAYSPCAPELGWKDTAAKPVISASQAPSCRNISA